MAIKFEIYRDGVRAAAYEPVSAMAVGPEGIPISGDIAFRDGLLIVNRKDDILGKDDSFEREVGAYLGLMPELPRMW